MFSSVCHTDIQLILILLGENSFLGSTFPIVTPKNETCIFFWSVEREFLSLL
jgi:hypothetical protein